MCFIVSFRERARIENIGCYGSVGKYNIFVRTPCHRTFWRTTRSSRLPMHLTRVIGWTLKGIGACENVRWRMRRGKGIALSADHCKRGKRIALRTDHCNIYSNFDLTTNSKLDICGVPLWNNSMIKRYSVILTFSGAKLSAFSLRLEVVLISSTTSERERTTIGSGQVVVVSSTYIIVIRKCSTN